MNLNNVHIRVQSLLMEYIKDFFVWSKTAFLWTDNFEFGSCKVSTWWHMHDALRTQDKTLSTTFNTYLHLLMHLLQQLIRLVCLQTQVKTQSRSGLNTKRSDLNSEWESSKPPWINNLFDQSMIVLFLRVVCWRGQIQIATANASISQYAWVYSLIPILKLMALKYAASLWNPPHLLRIPKKALHLITN